MENVITIRNNLLPFGITYGHLVYIVYGHLVYIVCGPLLYFSRFGMFGPRKSGNPAIYSEQNAQTNI
jgi:hypothetical protein